MNTSFPITISERERDEPHQIALSCRILGIGKNKNHKDLSLVKALRDKILKKAQAEASEDDKRMIIQAVKLASNTLHDVAKGLFSPFELMAKDIILMKQATPIIHRLMIPQPTNNEEDDLLDLIIDELIETVTPPATPSPLDEPINIEEAQELTEIFPATEPCLALVPFVPAGELATAPEEGAIQERQVDYIASHKWRSDSKKNFNKALEFMVKFTSLPSVKRTLLPELMDHQYALRAYLNDKPPARHPKSKRMYANARNTLYERVEEIRHLFEQD